MAGNGELAYTALVANVRLLPIDSDLTQTLRMGSKHFRRRYGVAVPPPEPLPSYAASLNSPALRARRTGGAVMWRWTRRAISSLAPAHSRGLLQQTGPSRSPTIRSARTRAKGTPRVWRGRLSPSRNRRLSCAARSRTRCPKGTPRPPSCEVWGCVSLTKFRIPTMARSGVGSSNLGTRVCLTMIHDVSQISSAAMTTIAR